MRFIKNKLLFVPVKEKPSTKLYHPRMVSSPRSLLRNPELQERNNGKTPHMERQLDTGSVTLHLTINGLSRMSINPYISFNSPTVPDKPCVMKLNHAMLSQDHALGKNPSRILAHAI